MATKMSDKQAVKSLPYKIETVTQQRAYNTEYLRQVHLTLEERVDVVVNELVYSLDAHFKRVDGQPLKVPETWVQHLKFKHAPKWFLKRWPLRFKIYTPQALFLDREIDLSSFATAGILYQFRGEDSDAATFDRDLTSGEKLHEAFKMLIRAANCLREISRDTEGGISQFAKTYEEHIINTLVSLNAPEYFLGGRVVKMTDDPYGAFTDN